MEEKAYVTLFDEGPVEIIVEEQGADATINLGPRKRVHLRKFQQQLRGIKIIYIPKPEPELVQ